MSVESAIEFYKKLATDAGFRAKLDAATKDERLVIIRDAGFRFTQPEYEEATNKILGQGSGELSDADLENVAGGTGIPGLGPTAAAAYGINYLPGPTTFPSPTTPGW
jgi:predicted ribosomally synthesized peptide with nif11-like leader